MENLEYEILIAVDDLVRARIARAAFALRMQGHLRLAAAQLFGVERQDTLQSIDRKVDQAHKNLVAEIRKLANKDAKP